MYILSQPHHIHLQYAAPVSPLANTIIEIVKNQLYSNLPSLSQNHHTSLPGHHGVQNINPYRDETPPSPTGRASCESLPHLFRKWSSCKNYRFPCKNLVEQNAQAAPRLLEIAVLSNAAPVQCARQSAMS